MVNRISESLMRLRKKKRSSSSVNRILESLKRLRKKKRSSSSSKLSVSAIYSHLQKCHYRDVDALLALSYPAGYLLNRNRKKFTRANFKMSPDLPRDFGFHGLFASPWFRMQQKLMLRAEAARLANANKKLPQLTKELQDRIVRSMPYLTSVKSLQLMDHEREKHVPEIDFLDYNTYPEFAVRLFENFKFNKLLSSVVEEISRDQTPVWEFSYYREEWIGIRLADLRSIAEKYKPLSEAGSESKLTFRLIPTQLAVDQFFLFEAHVGVTKDGRLKRGGPTSSVFDNVTEIPTPDSIVLLWNRLQY